VTAPFGTAKRDFERDGRGRPRIQCLDGKTRSFTRVTTFIDCLEDKTTLAKWGERMVLIGALTGTAQDRTGLAKKVLAAQAVEDKNTLNELADNAKTRARASDKAEDGTATHTLTELLDTGRDLPAGLDAATLADLQAYEAGTLGLEPLGVEVKVVNDQYETAGTYDRTFRVLPGFFWPEWLVGRVVVGDLKTGRVDFGLAKMAMQLGVYANSVRYDPETHERTPLGADLAAGLILHLPAGEARLDVYALDIAFGYRAVGLAQQVRQYRAAARRTAEFSQLVASVTADGEVKAA
jgi:hypothetical protein